MPIPKWHYTRQNECPRNIVILTHPVGWEHRYNSLPISPVRIVEGHCHPCNGRSKSKEVCYVMNCGKFSGYWLTIQTLTGIEFSSDPLCIPLTENHVQNHDMSRYYRKYPIRKWLFPPKICWHSWNSNRNHQTDTGDPNIAMRMMTTNRMGSLDCWKVHDSLNRMAIGAEIIC